MSKVDHNKVFNEHTFETKEEWLEWRKGGVGASEVSSLTGRGFGSAESLLKSKLSLTHPYSNEAMQRGLEEEGKARKMAEDVLGKRYPPIYVSSYQNARYIASLDGYCAELGEVMEIKTPASLQSYKKYKGYLERGEVPPQWEDQVQWQLFITGAFICRFVLWNADFASPYIATITHDPEKGTLLKMKVDEFLEKLDEALFAGELIPSHPFIDAEELNDELDRYESCMDEEKRLAEKKAKSKERILSLCQKECDTPRFKIRKSAPRKRYDYTALRAAVPDPDEFVTGTTDPIWSISRRSSLPTLDI